MSTPTRLTRSMSPAAMVVAILALVLAAAGAGYAGGRIGTQDLRNGAVTTPKIRNDAVTGAKIRNGQVSNADLVREHRFVAIGSPGGPAFYNGGEGDCVWTGRAGLFPGSGPASIMTDRFGVVHLAGAAESSEGPSGDGRCDSSDPTELEDGIMMILPPSLRPAHSLILPSAVSADGAVTYIAGVRPIVFGDFVLPAGAVYNADLGTVLDGISYYPASSHTAARGGVSTEPAPGGKALLRLLGGSTSRRH